MQQPVDTGRRENPAAPERLERVLLVGTRLRGRHYGQRSCVPHQQVEHMAAPTSSAEHQITLANGEPSTQGAEPPSKGQQGSLGPQRATRLCPAGTNRVQDSKMGAKTTKSANQRDGKLLKNGAAGGNRTRDIQLGKLTFYL